MPSISNLPARDRDDLITRLRKIEGQARGIQKMIEDGRDCTNILDQVSSVKSAVNSLSGELLESFALYCVRHPDESTSTEETLQLMVRTLVRHTR